MIQLAQVMYVHCKHVGHMCTVQISRIGIIFVHHGGIMPMLKVHYMRSDINIMMLFECSLLMSKWMRTLFLCCYKDAGVSLQCIPYFPLNV